VDPNQNLVSTFLLTNKLEALAPLLAISNTLAHQTFILAWEKLVILDEIKKIWIFPFVSNVIIIVSSTILLLVEDQYYLSLQHPLVVFSSSSIKFLSPHHHQIETSKLFLWLS
jgi:hypothetical protein